jgi:hypothetical protein
MDSWTEKQIAAMEKSGGNAALDEYLSSKGIPKDMMIAKKYNTPQAAYYRERLSRWLEGKTEPPPDPGNYDPTTGGGDAQGAEPLPGESTEEYNARQARLKEQARERLRAKFGDGGMGGMGSPEEPSAAQQASAAVNNATSAVRSSVAGMHGLLKEKVIDNTELHKLSSKVDTAKDKAKDVAASASGMWNSLKQNMTEGDLSEKLKRNATLEEGSAVRKGFGWGLGAATSLWAKASDNLNDLVAGNTKPCEGEHQLHVDPRGDVKCALCQVKGTRYACSRGCEYYICPKCFEKPPPAAAKSKAAASSGAGGFDDDDWDAWEEETKETEPLPEVTQDDMERLAKELGMNLSAEEPAKAAVPEVAISPDIAVQPKAKPKAKPVDEDDFFADF